MSNNIAPRADSPLRGFNINVSTPIVVPATLQFEEGDPGRMAVALQDPSTTQILIIRCIRLSEAIVASVAFANSDGTFDQIRLSSAELLRLARGLEQAVATNLSHRLRDLGAMVEALYHAARQKAEFEPSYLPPAGLKRT